MGAKVKEAVLDDALKDPAFFEVHEEAHEMLLYDPKFKCTDRAHAYLVNHRVTRGSNDTALEVAVCDMLLRAYAAGMARAGGSAGDAPKLRRLADALAKCADGVTKAAAEVAKIGGADG